MKIKQEEEKEEEKIEEEKEEEKTEETTEEEKKLAELVSKKIETLMGIMKDNPVKKSPVFREEPTYEKSILETDPYMRSKRPFVKLSKQMDDFVGDMKRMAKGMIIKHLAEDTDTAGGFLVPEEFQAEVVRYTTENAIIRPRARVFTMARDTLTLPKLDQSSNRHGGATAYWAEESIALTESTPAFGRLTLKAKKLIGLCYASDEVLEDSAINLANYLVSLFGEVLAYEEDYRFLRGTGVLQPLGITLASGTNGVARQTSSRIQLDDVVAMYVAHPAYADANAVWLTTKAGIGQLMKMGEEGTTGVTLWMMNLRDAIVPIMQGKEILVTDKLPGLGSRGDIVLADLSQYYIGDRGGLAVASSIHERFTYDETTFRFVKRVDGQPAIATAFTILTE